MANVATLLQSLVLSGSRLSDGTPNQTGTLNAYTPGTLVSSPLYSDPAGTVAVTQPITLDNGGRIPVATYANGLYTTVPVRLIVKDVSGNVVSDVTYVAGSAGNVGVNNASFPTETTVDGVLTALGTSFGGTDGNFLEHSGATNRSIQSKFREIWVSVKDYGAAGDNLTDDTAAIQTALNRIVAIGSGVLYFPPGTYKISGSALSLAASVGVTLQGAGGNISIIRQTTASTNVLNVAAGNSFSLVNIAFTGGPVVVTNQSVVTVNGCEFNGGSAGTGLTFTGGGSNIVIFNSAIGGSTCLALSDATQVSVIATQFSAQSSGTAVSLAGAAGSVQVYGCQFSGSIAKGFKWQEAATGTKVNVTDCPSLGSVTTPFDTSSISTDPGVIQRGNLYDVEAIAVASTPVTIVPRTIAPATQFNVTGTSGGTVTISPIVGAANGANTAIELRFLNRSGGTITWVFTSGYSLSAAIPTTNGSTTTVGMWWDTAVSQFRERYRTQL